MCSEPWSRRGPAKAAVAQAERRQLICAGFPKGVERPQDWRRPRLDVPLLALVGGSDPRNPVRNIAGIKEGVPHSRLVVVPGQGRVVGGLGCMPYLIERFLDRGSAEGLDVSCAQQVSLPAWRYR